MPDADRLEEELRLEREALRSKLSLLGSQFTPDRMATQASQTAQVIGGKLVRGAVDVARHNKMPLALTGTGLAWLAISAAVGTRPSAPRVAYDTRSEPTSPGLRDEHVNDPSLGDFDDRVAAADRAMKRDAALNPQEGDYDMTYPKHAPTDSDTTRMDRLRETIENGLDGLPDAAKQRVRAAREAAMSAQERARIEAAKAADTVRTTAHENPMLVGALAFAAGAALAAMLPRTSTENRIVGGQRDRLFDEADRVLQEERAKLTEAATGFIADGQAKVKEAVTGGSKNAEKDQTRATRNGKAEAAAQA
ncbi:hypothetical protein KUL25_08845 [Rhodobacteraceae bacterium N5(2021)]|uniref:DUF3618 domain-containing protein n=1 Tax=Gymnodinialimonas phycosphaerae TaxID=2841589 RepID=A0A975TXW0_9RHOB|nr:hypothetical protein [Gymnodinialimonas phycosphaerae]MBY4892868.1 hypothetical protein [Gymnodinialimonas phycosphaerae]